MAYLGQQPVVGRYILLDQISGGFNGTTSGFTMSTAGGAQGVIPGLAQNVLLSLGGVIQQPGVDYTISGSGLTFTTPPVSGTTFFATVLGDAQSVGTPSDGTVTPASIASGYDFAFPNLNVTGVVTIASGSAASPSLTITGDLNTGLYSPGADQVAISTSGTGRLFVDSSGRVKVGDSPSVGVLNVRAATNGNLHFRDISTVVGSGTGVVLDVLNDASSAVQDLALRGATTIFRNATSETLRITSDGKLGLGTSSPGAKLSVQGGQGGISNPANGTIDVIDETTAALGVGGQIVFRGQFQSGAYTQYGAITAYKESATVDGSQYGASLVFNTRTQGGNNTEKMRLDSSGRLGVGTTSPQGNLEVSNSSSGATIRLTRPSSADYELYASSDTFILTDKRQSSERLRIDSSGRLLVGTSSAGGTELIQVQGTSGGSNLPGGISLRRSSLGNGDDIGYVNFTNASGNIHAGIKAFADGTPGAGDYPGALVFSTTADGASSPTERMRIGNQGNVSIGANFNTIVRLALTGQSSTSADFAFAAYNAAGTSLLQARNDGVIQTGTAANSPYNLTTGAGANVHVNSAGTLYRSTSSIRFKTDIESLEDSYADAILTIEPVWYRSTAPGDQIHPDWSYYGFIAEDVAKVDPRLVFWKTHEAGQDKDGKPTLTPLDEPIAEGVQYDRFVPHLLNLIKRQQQAIEDLQAEVAALKAQ